MVGPGYFYVKLNKRGNTLVRTPKNMESMRMNIDLKNGEQYGGVDPVPVPFGSHDRIVSFWWQDCVMIIPMALVQRVVLVFEGETESGGVL